MNGQVIDVGHSVWNLAHYPEAHKYGEWVGQSTGSWQSSRLETHVLSEHIVGLDGGQIGLVEHILLSVTHFPSQHFN